MSPMRSRCFSLRSVKTQHEDLKKTSGLLRRDDEIVRFWLDADDVSLKGRHAKKI
jgi:hypothetical protein